MKVKILGTEYEIIMNAEEKDYPKLKGLSGYTDFSIKKIVIRKIEKDDASLEDLEHYRREVIRHEIIHAFFYESGLDGNSDYARNEELIDWIAIQFEKLLVAFIHSGAINIECEFLKLANDPINNPINPPKYKEAKAFINPVTTITNKSNKEIIEEISKAMEQVNSGMIGGDG